MEWFMARISSIVIVIIIIWYACASLARLCNIGRLFEHSSVAIVVIIVVHFICLLRCPTNSMMLFGFRAIEYHHVRTWIYFYFWHNNNKHHDHKSFSVCEWWLICCMMLSVSVYIMESEPLCVWMRCCSLIDWRNKWENIIIINSMENDIDLWPCPVLKCRKWLMADGLFCQQFFHIFLA